MHSILPIYLHVVHLASFETLLCLQVSHVLETRWTSTFSIRMTTQKNVKSFDTRSFKKKLTKDNWFLLRWINSNFVEKKNKYDKSSYLSQTASTTYTQSYFRPASILPNTSLANWKLDGRHEQTCKVMIFAFLFLLFSNLALLKIKFAFQMNLNAQQATNLLYKQQTMSMISDFFLFQGTLSTQLFINYLNRHFLLGSTWMSLLWNIMRLSNWKYETCIRL